MSDMPVSYTPRPTDTSTTAYDESWTVVDGVLTEGWVARPKTAEETATATRTANDGTLRQQAKQDITNVRTSIDNLNIIIAKANVDITPKDTKDVAREAKAIGKATIRLMRLVLGELDSTDAGA